MGSLSVQQQPYTPLLGGSCWQQQPPPPPSSTHSSSREREREDEELSALIGGWKLSELNIHPSAPSSVALEEECEVHPGNVLAFWCGGCVRPACAVCVKDLHTEGKHSLTPLADSASQISEAVATESRSLGNLLSEVYHFERKQQDLMLKLIDALQAVKEELEGGLISGGGLVGGGELREIHSLLQSQQHSAALSPKSLPLPLLRSLNRHRTSLQTLLANAHPLHGCCQATAALQLIHQFTAAKLCRSLKPNGCSAGGNTLGPRFFFDMECVGVGPLGRVVIETRPDVAPRMAENFGALVRGERGFGFEGCVVFQCWRGESVITGDFEHQNGRGGHSIFPSGLFMPEDTRLPATRGALGMRRTQKRHDSKGLVGSQFRIILQDMPGFTGIFGAVREGIEVVERIAECGDASGNPTKRVVVRRCGEI